MNPHVMFGSTHRKGFSVSTGVWDQAFTLGLKNQDGETIVIDESVCSRMMDNFASRKNDMGMDYEHSSVKAPPGTPVPQLAFHNALALVVGGRVVKFVSHAAGVQPPTGDGMTDGLFAHRARVTPLGEKLLPNYEQISPLFSMQDTNERGEDIGPNLVNLSAVSLPFQDGTSLAFAKYGSAQPPTQKETSMSKHEYGVPVQGTVLSHAMKAFSAQTGKPLHEAHRDILRHRPDLRGGNRAYGAPMPIDPDDGRLIDKIVRQLAGEEAQAEIQAFQANRRGVHAFSDRGETSRYDDANDRNLRERAQIVAAQTGMSLAAAQKLCVVSDPGLVGQSGASRPATSEEAQAYRNAVAEQKKRERDRLTTESQALADARAIRWPGIDPNTQKVDRAGTK